MQRELLLHYHVLNRGDRREAIFRIDADRKRFLELLAQICRRTGWQIHAYCLTDNHFHLVVETPRSNLSAGMQWLLGTYTQCFNRRHVLWGHLFGGRYKALLVDEPMPVSILGGQVTGDGRQVSDSGLASASRRELVWLMRRDEKVESRDAGRWLRSFGVASHSVTWRGVLE